MLQLNQLMPLYYFLCNERWLKLRIKERRKAKEVNEFLFVGGTVLVPVKSYFGNFFELNFPFYLVLNNQNNGWFLFNYYLNYNE